MTIKINITCLFLLVLPVIGQTCTQTFTTANIGSSPYPGSNVNTAVQNGDGTTVLCFSSGSYGEINLYNAHPSGIVRMIPASGASAVMGVLNLNGVSNLTITGFNSGSQISGGLQIVNAGQGDSSNITFSNNDMGASSVLIRDNVMANANILISGNTITNYITGGGFEPAMMVLNTGTSNCPNGIVFRGNHVDGSIGDGMGTGGPACGTQFLNNEIENFVQSSCGGVHCDGFQDVGNSVQTLIEGNYFHNNSLCFGLYDGSSGMIIRNNVCSTASDSGYWMQFGGALNITFSHNTVISAAGAQYGNDHEGDPSSNVTFINNIFPSQPSQNVGEPISGTLTSNYNLCVSACTGANSITGSPTFVGGATPATYAGYTLTAESSGYRDGSDGRDIGVIFSSPTTLGGGTWRITVK
jgi:hypothetical protein